MLVCPNKSSKEWNSLVEAIGEDQAMLSFIRNNNEIPSSVNKARDLITNVGLLNSLETIPTLTEEKVFETLVNQGLAFDSYHDIDGRRYYALNTDVSDLGARLATISSDFGAILEYKGEYVTVSPQGMASWNAIAQQQNSNKKTPVELAKSFLSRIGVKVSEQNDIIKRYGSNGVAQFAERMVLIQSGKMEEALPEEAMHFFLDLIPQDTPELIEALDKIRDTKIYKDTLAKYKDNPNYRTKDGQIRFDKIKKEALAKHLVSQQKAPTTLFGKLIKKILDWIKGTKIQRSPFDILTELYMSQDISRMNMNFTSDEVYNQLNDDEKAFYEAQDMNEEQRNTLNNIIALTSRIQFEEESHRLQFVDPITGDTMTMKSATQLLGSDFYSELETEDVMNEIVFNYEMEFPGVTDAADTNEEKAAKLSKFLVDKIIKGEYEKEDISLVVGPKIAELLFQSSENRKKTLFGTAIHNIAEAIILDKTIDFDNPEIVDPIIYNFMDKNTLRDLVYGTARTPGIVGILSDRIKAGDVLMTEVQVGNGKVGGIIDIIAIDKNGVVNILDFKTKYLKDRPEFKKFAKLEDEFEYVTGLMSLGGVKFDDNVLPEMVGKRRSNMEKYGQQLSIYKKVLMQAGVSVGDITVIGVPYKLDSNGRVTKIKAFVTSPLSFNDKIAAGYFTDLDVSKDASRKADKATTVDERTKLLESVSKPTMKIMFAKMKTKLDQLYAYFKKNKDARAVYDMLSDEDGSNRVEDMQRLVTNFLDNYGEDGDMTNMLAIQEGFLEMVDSAGPIIQLISDAFDKVAALTPATQEAASQKMNELMKMKDFVVGYQNMFEDMLKYMGTTDPSNLIVSRLTQMVGALSNIRNRYIDAITPELISALGAEFTTELLDNIKREYNELILAAEQRGDKKRATDLRTERDNLPSEKVIAELLKGEKGDAGWFYSKFLPTISNPDIVIAAVAKRLKRVLDKVRIMMKEFRDSLSVEFDKRAKVYGKGLNVKEINQSLVYDAKRFDPTTGTTEFQLTFKSEFDEELYHDYDKLRYELAKAVESKDKEAISAARKALKDFEVEYFMSDYTAEYYKLTKAMDTVVNYGGERLTVREITGNIFNEIRFITSQYDKESLAEGNMKPEHLQEVQRLWEQYYSLMELKNPDGTDKTGDALTIAKSLQEYNKNKRILFKDVELTGMFEKMKSKMMLKYGKESDEYKRWLANNTRMKISDRYYEEMDALMKELAALSTNPNAEKISELYAELRTITQPFKDKDGYINGSFMSAEKVQRIKDIQAEIKDLQDQVDEYTPDGFTFEEKQILKEQFYLRKNDPVEYDKFAVQEIYAARDARLEADENLKARVERANAIKTQLASMRTTENTKYYYEELEKQERIFAEAAGITYEELKTNAELYQQFRESDWFQENHTHTSRPLFDDTFGSTVVSESYTPIYIWTRNVPIKEYIEEAPARHFYKRELNESYENEAGETVVLINKDNRDILNRFKPKPADQYKAQYGKDHKYLNKDYVALRDKYNNKTATEKEKVDYENLLYIHRVMNEHQEGIEPRYRLGLAVPFQEKSMLERTLESQGRNVKDSVQDAIRGLKRKFTKTEASASEGFGETSGRPSDFSKLATIDNDEVRYVPVKYTSKGKASDNSYDVWGSLLNYVGSTIRKKELDKELALINGLEEVLGEKENQPKGEAKNLMINKVMSKYFPDSPELSKRINLGANTRLEVLKSFVNSVLYNEEHFEGYDILGVNTQKAVDKLMGLSSFTMLGLSPFNWTVNWLSGNVQNMVEAAAGRYYDFKSFMSAKKEIYMSTKYGYIMKDMMTDFSKVGYKSFWGQVMEVFDPIQGDFENEFGQKTSWNAGKNILKLGIFAGKVWGEWEIQMSSFIAFMKNVRLHNGKMYDKESFVTMRVGTDFTGMTLKEVRAKKAEALREFDKLETNLLDILELRNGKLAVKAQYATAFDFSSKQFSDLVGKLHSMQKRINGSYAKFDQAYAAKSSIGRMMFFFRKYFIQLGMNRLGFRRPDFEGMTVEEGFYLTFAKTVMKDLFRFRLNFVKNWNNYSDSERANIMRTMADLSAMLVCFAIYGLLFGYDPDDEDRMKKLKKQDWFSQAMIFTMLKVKSETEQFIPAPGMGLDELQRIYSNPSILFGTVTNFLVMFGQVLGHMGELVGMDFPSLYYKKDSGENIFKEEGDSKLVAEIMKTFFGYTGKTMNPIDAIKAYDFYSRKDRF